MKLKNRAVQECLKEARRSRKEIVRNRESFWKKNRENFEKNITELAGLFRYPKKWKVNIIASRFLPMGAAEDLWSFSDVLSATKKQGFDIVVFFNKANMEFLSKAAMLPIVVHEMKHVSQGIKDPKKYATQTVDDKLYASYEAEAEAEIKKYPDELRKQAVFEKIIYNYYTNGWKGAREEAHYLHKLSKNYYGDGYEEEMSSEEYEIFLEAEKRKDLDYFVKEMLKRF